MSFHSVSDLRLLLPLNAQVWESSRMQAGNMAGSRHHHSFSKHSSFELIVPTQSISWLLHHICLVMQLFAYNLQLKNFMFGFQNIFGGFECRPLSQHHFSLYLLSSKTHLKKIGSTKIRTGDGWLRSAKHYLCAVPSHTAGFFQLENSNGQPRPQIWKRLFHYSHGHSLCSQASGLKRRFFIL